ncbi:hypothetical protein Cfor_08958 [Coptotermes formosanus]|uniref:Complex I assembly factor TIMMDC1, mitochondrial n=1 Tax=Coptotermes formosanus TaxID=36987 RepID=A0A6L2PX49_COPFO|nr:hypothetical protein Cfor_08958 [Coptotermes formosanus]
MGDNDKTESPTSQSFYRRNVDNETGWERLYLMYSLDEFGNVSPELNAACQAGFTGMFVGACYGGIVNSKIAYTDFMERNDATVFKSHLEAKKKLQDQVTIAFGKGAFRWGWRLGLFTGSYVLLTTSVSVYRGYSSILEYVAAGCITGALYKFNMGLAGMAVGGGLGGVLGGIAGLVSLTILKLSGMSMEEWGYADCPPVYLLVHIPFEEAWIHNHVTKQTTPHHHLWIMRIVAFVHPRGLVKDQ